MYASRTCEMELSVGDVVVVGETVLTVVDIDGTDVSFRVESTDAAEQAWITAADLSSDQSE